MYSPLHSSTTSISVANWGLDAIFFQQLSNSTIVRKQHFLNESKNHLKFETDFNERCEF